MRITSDTALETLLKRDRAVVIAALVALAGLAWADVVWLERGMRTAAAGPTGMGMPATDMTGPEWMLPAGAPWSTFGLAVAFLMWCAMMVGMMLPSAAPMLLMYARVGRQAATLGRPFAATAWFIGGYLLMWTAFAAAATLAQWGLGHAALLTSAAALAGQRAGGAVLLAAGLYQWTPLKSMCLRQCQAPLVFIQQHGGFRPDAAGALQLGARHGLHCIGCCWALMGLLFVGGIMNLLWIAGLAVLVLVEKIASGRVPVARLTGSGLLGAGAWLLWVAG